VIVKCSKQSISDKHLPLALNRSFHCRYKAVGIRLDSGDLAYLSVEARKFFHAVEKEFVVVGFGKTSITASNDLNEETIDALNKQVTYIVSIQNI
jgi:nicotinic acid phosphoribosyltransferase